MSSWILVTIVLGVIWTIGGFAGFISNVAVVDKAIAHKKMNRLIAYIILSGPFICLLALIILMSKVYTISTYYILQEVPEDDQPPKREPLPTPKRIDPTFAPPQEPQQSGQSDSSQQ